MDAKEDLLVQVTTLVKTMLSQAESYQSSSTKRSITLLYLGDAEVKYRYKDDVSSITIDGQGYRLEVVNEPAPSIEDGTHTSSKLQLEGGSEVYQVRWVELDQPVYEVRGVQTEYSFDEYRDEVGSTLVGVADQISRCLILARLHSNKELG